MTTLQFQLIDRLTYKWIDPICALITLPRALTGMC